MRVFLAVVAACFIGLGMALVIMVIPRLIESSGGFYNFESGLMAWLSAATPGGVIIIFGSVTYMLCSIDRRLQDIAENGGLRAAPQPRAPDPYAAPLPGLPTAIQPPPVRQDPGRPDDGDPNHGLF
jgi:hypothetical protein